MYILTFNAAQNGHTCLPRPKLVEAAASLLGVSAEAVSAEVDKLIIKGRLFSETVGVDTYIYESQQYKNDRYIAEKLWRLKCCSAPLDFKDIEAFVRKEEAQNRIEYADEQKKAIFNAMTSGVLVLTGGPGTGKTTVVTAIINIFECLGLEVALAAPTGRAAKRMTEATGREAKTVHRLLEKSISIPCIDTYCNIADENEADKTSNLSTILHNQISTPTAISFIVFILLYLPCIATIAAISYESESWKWGIFSALFSTSVAYILAFVTYQIANLCL